MNSEEIDALARRIAEACKQLDAYQRSHDGEVIEEIYRRLPRGIVPAEARTQAEAEFVAARLRELIAHLDAEIARLREERYAYRKVACWEVLSPTKRTHSFTRAGAEQFVDLAARELQTPTPERLIDERRQG